MSAVAVDIDAINFATIATIHHTVRWVKALPSKLEQDCEQGARVSSLQVVFRAVGLVTELERHALIPPSWIGM
jgi:hypothetical protein